METTEKKGHYIISLKHTMPKDKFITLWRPDNAGYCWAKDMAGVYDTIKPGYHDSDNNFPVEVSVLEKLFITDDKFWYGKSHDVIPNTKAVWDILGIRKVKSGLVRKETSII